MDIPTVLGEVERWSIDARVELVELLWNQISNSHWQPTLTEAQKTELDRRIQASVENADDVLEWEDIKRHVSRDR